SFGLSTAEYKRYLPAAGFTEATRYCFEASHVVDSLRSHKGVAIGLLRQAVSSLEERLAEEAVPVLDMQTNVEHHKSRKVFVVHGHDVGVREAVSRFLERADFEPIVLHEQANQGRTIIEKFETHADVSFAVVLLTPDDVGGTDETKLQPRARQNVI